jgi:hypothetical protein
MIEVLLGNSTIEKILLYITKTSAPTSHEKTIMKISQNMTIGEFAALVRLVVMAQN